MQENSGILLSQVVEFKETTDREVLYPDTDEGSQRKHGESLSVGELDCIVNIHPVTEWLFCVIAKA